METSDLIFIFLKVALVLFLVLLNGFFVAAEFAIVKIRETQLQPMVIKGHGRAKVAQRLVKNLDAALSATQLGITLASLGLGWVGEPVFASLLEPLMHKMHIQSPELQHGISFAFGFSVITFLHIVVGELAPKSMAIQKPLPVTLWIARPLEWFYKLSYPFNWALNKTAAWLLRLVGIHAASESELVHSEEELRLLFTASQEHSGGTSLGRDVVLNALELSRRLARDVMRPRQEIVSFDTTLTISECLDIAEKTRYSRFPLARGGNLDETIGVIHFKDLFAQRLKIKTAAELEQSARKLIYVPPTARLERLLALFLERKLHMAIVVDEYGVTMGMVTLENILEELVGQIQDEFDQEKPLVNKINEHTWELDGAYPLHDLESLLGESIDDTEAVTTSGYVTERLSGFPREGDIISIGEFDLRVDASDGTTVTRLTLKKRTVASSGAGEQVPG
ncbi:MAG: hemolysin family protein [Verrucomicrobiota bacterium]|nr:hemolysin family protein [Verrucomicrobiota bacterium]